MLRLNRMEVTLGCLVASMTLGAAVLDWSQPNGAYRSLSPTELTALHLKDKIDRSMESQAQAGQWSSIYIGPRADTQSSPVADCHIVIERDGQCAVSDDFIKGQSLPGYQGQVRIGMVVSGRDTQASSSQIQVAERLVHILKKKCAISDHQIELDRSLLITSHAG